MGFARVWLGANGALFLVYGFVCLFAPGVPAGYAGIDLPGPSAANEVAAMYGGLQAGLGGLLLYAAAHEERVRMGLMVLVVLLGSLAIGRAVGLLSAGVTEYNVAALVYEATAAGLGVLGMRLVAAREGALA